MTNIRYEGKAQKLRGGDKIYVGQDLRMSGLQAASFCWRCNLRWEGEQERSAQPASG